MCRRELVTPRGTSKTKTSDREKRAHLNISHVEIEEVIGMPPRAVQFAAMVCVQYPRTFIVDYYYYFFFFFCTRRKDLTIPLRSPITIPSTPFVLFIQTVYCQYQINK
jgi:hypothetical protein